jgi:hypothetical protein
MSIRNKPRDAVVYGVDIGKNVFHLVGLDTSGTQIDPEGSAPSKRIDRRSANSERTCGV